MPVVSFSMVSISALLSSGSLGMVIRAAGASSSSMENRPICPSRFFFREEAISSIMDSYTASSSLR